MSAENRVVDSENQQQDDRIVAIWTEDQVYTAEEYEIQPWGATSLRLIHKRSQAGKKRYLVIPARTITRIEFEEAEHVNS